MTGSSKRPLGVTIVAGVNALGWFATLGFWLALHLEQRIPVQAAATSYWEHAYVGTIRGFAVADSLWSNALLLASVVGLWSLRPWGWTTALMANAIWIYSMTVAIVRDLLTQVTAGMVFFVPFALFALGSSVYLWRQRQRFWVQSLEDAA